MAPETEAGRLYDIFGAALYRYALMILADREAAEDVVQQVFVTLIGRGVGDIDQAERYLRRAVRNACYSSLRHERIRRGPALDDVLLEVVDRKSGISEEERLTIDAAIRQLPPEQREAVHLHAFEGRTFKEAAELTGESLNTMASRYRYALEKVKATVVARHR